MGQITSSDVAHNLTPGLKTIFMHGWKGLEPPFKQIVTEVDSTLPSESYGWLGQLPAVREWTDERIPKGLAEYGYTIRNKKSEVSVKPNAETLEGEHYGQVKDASITAGGIVKSMRRILVAAGLAVSLTVAGCSGPWSSSPQSPPPADGGTFETLEDLRVAVEGAGFQCPELQLANHAKYASTSGYCGEVGMALYPNDASWPPSWP